MLRRLRPGADLLAPFARAACGTTASGVRRAFTPAALIDSRRVRPVGGDDIGCVELMDKRRPRPRSDVLRAGDVGGEGSDVCGDVSTLRLLLAAAAAATDGDACFGVPPPIDLTPAVIS